MDKRTEQKIRRVIWAGVIIVPILLIAGFLGRGMLTGLWQKVVKSGTDQIIAMEKSDYPANSIVVKVSDRWQMSQITDALTAYRSANSLSELAPDQQQVMTEINAKILISAQTAPEIEDVTDQFIWLEDSQGQSVDIAKYLADRKGAASKSQNQPVSFAMPKAEAAASYSLNKLDDLLIIPPKGKMAWADFTGLFNGIDINTIFIDSIAFPKFPVSGELVFEDESDSAPLTIAFRESDYNKIKANLDQAKSQKKIEGFDITSRSGMAGGSGGYHIVIKPKLGFDNDTLTNLFDDISTHNVGVQIDTLSSSNLNWMPDYLNDIRLADFDSKLTLKKFITDREFDYDLAEEFLQIDIFGRKYLKENLTTKLDELEEAEVIDSYDFIDDEMLFLPDYAHGLYIINPLDTDENFLFSPSVPVALQKDFIEYYPKIAAIYGGNRLGREGEPLRVGVLNKCSNPNAFYADVVDIILICHDRAIKKTSTAVHEMAHAFTGFYNLFAGDVWSEGQAVTVTEYVLGMTDLTNPCNRRSYDGMRISEANNVPFFDYMRSSPYLYGSSIVAKAYLEDKNFIANFNRNLQEMVDSKIDYEDSLLSEVMEARDTIEHNNLISNEVFAKSLTTLEGQPINDWIAGHFILTRNEYGILGNNPAVPSVEIQGERYGQLKYPNNTNYYLLKSVFDKKTDKLDYRSSASGSPLNLNLYKSDGQLLYSSSAIGTASGGVPVTLPSYQGLVKTVAVIDSENYNQYFAKVNKLTADDPVYGLVIGGDDTVQDAGLWRGGSIVDVTGSLQDSQGNSLDSFNQNNIPVKNGMFIISDPLARKAGKFTVTVRGKKTACDVSGCRSEDMPVMHYFNKTDVSGYVTIVNVNTTNVCYQLESVTGLYAGSTAINSIETKKKDNCNKNAGQVLMDKDSKSIARCYGNNCKFYDIDILLTPAPWKIFYFETPGQKPSQFLGPIEKVEVVTIPKKTYKISVTTSNGGKSEWDRDGFGHESDNISIPFTPEPGYFVSKIIFDGEEVVLSDENRGVGAWAGNPRFSIGNLSKDHTLHIVFAKQAYVVMISHQGDGDGTPVPTMEVVSAGESRTYTAVPADGSVFTYWAKCPLVNCEGQCVVENIQSDVMITPEFIDDTVDGGGNVGESNLDYTLVPDDTAVAAVSTTEASAAKKTVTAVASFFSNLYTRVSVMLGAAPPVATESATADTEVLEQSWDIPAELASFDNSNTELAASGVIEIKHKEESCAYESSGTTSKIYDSHIAGAEWKELIGDIDGDVITVVSASENLAELDSFTAFDNGKIKYTEEDYPFAKKAIAADKPAGVVVSKPITGKGPILQNSTIREPIKKRFIKVESLLNSKNGLDTPRIKSIGLTFGIGKLVCPAKPSMVIPKTFAGSKVKNGVEDCFGSDPEFVENSGQYVEMKSFGKTVIVSRYIVIPLLKAEAKYKIQKGKYKVNTVFGTQLRANTKSKGYWSSHMWGLAVDINAGELPQGKKANGEVDDDFIQVMQESGFYWGDAFSTPDPMHWQYFGSWR